jgi:hypothetical protein
VQPLFQARSPLFSRSKRPRYSHPRSRKLVRSTLAGAYQPPAR